PNPADRPRAIGVALRPDDRASPGLRRATDGIFLRRRVLEAGYPASAVRPTHLARARSAARRHPHPRRPLRLRLRLRLRLLRLPLHRDRVAAWRWQQPCTHSIPSWRTFLRRVLEPCCFSREFLTYRRSNLNRPTCSAQED